MADKKLTALQQDFIRQLFGAAQGSLEKAAKALSLSDYNLIIDDAMLDAIKKRGDSEITMNVARAIHVISKMMNDEEGALFVNDKLHKVATDILDRAGISKQERPSNGSTAMGLVFLPNKQILPEPPQEALDEKAIQHSFPV